MASVARGMRYRTIDLTLPHRLQRVPIVVGSGLTRRVGEFLRERIPHGRRIGIVSHARIFRLHGQALLHGLRRAGWAPQVFLLPEGERTKSLRWATWLWGQLLKQSFDRHSPLIAFGGGVVGDLTGFVAATYGRGIPLVQLPSTLVAQVDSAVGGKTGINLPEAKNMVGSYHHPVLVVADVDLLATLPFREYVAGLAEVWKMAFVSDPAFCRYLRDHRSPLLRADPRIVLDVVGVTCYFKARVVELDEREEGGFRLILNYGHTIGHALEAAGGFRRYLHGEAIAVGMAAAARIASHLGVCSEDVTHAQIEVLKEFGLPVRVPRREFDGVCSKLRFDKKRTGGQSVMVFLKEISSPVVVRGVPLHSVLAGLG